ncbi:MAG: SRPBCC family protein [Geothrix sp.]|nr:SRPBCC family protein [Geothrix sp.]
MAGSTDQHLDLQTDRDVLTTRVLDAPRERVFRAWTDPGLLARWWGPAGFTNSFQAFDPRPGGPWNFTMRGPDGTHFENESVFIEVLAPERIVFDHVSTPPFRVIVTFEAEGPRTRLGFCMRFRTAAECEAVKGFALQGNEQTFDRLAALLAEG